jgi:hypothetical protein
MRVPGLFAVLAAAVAPGLAAQQSAPMPESYRAVQLSALQLQRRMLLAMVDSMPESLYRDRATPAQRDFAQQIHHAASAAAFLVSRFMSGPELQLPDTAAALNSREGLRSLVNASYDYAEGVLRTQPADARGEIVAFLAGTRMPRWQIWDEIHMHTVWTCGQVVANFRKHGMAPPGFGFF